MAYTTINKSTDYFNTKIYTGDATTSHAITGINFQPDMTWIKSRTSTDTHAIFDAVRGATKRIIPDNNTAEGTQSNGLTSFDSDGFTLGDAGLVNQNYNYASWNWLANGTGSANTYGSINSTVSVNQTAGFSIVKWTGTQSLGTVGHGLNSVPKMIIIKNTSALENWIVYHNSLGNTKNLYLDEANAEHTRSDTFNNTSPTSSVFTVNTATGVNKTGSTMIAYCFEEKTGYSKFGSYTGNGSTDGTFIYTGFKPAFLIVKNTNAGEAWGMHDNKRPGLGNGNAPVGHFELQPNLTNAENSSGAAGQIDFLSNGFKLRTATNSLNVTQNYIYMAFGQSLVGSNNVPCTAR